MTDTRPVAAIDCGTNSIRLLISRPVDGVPTDVVRVMRIVRLGEGIDTTGRIAAAALDRTAEALREYATIIAEHDPVGIRMVATSASRDADNAEEFRDLVKRTIGVTPEVITGDEEAALSFAGAVADLPAIDGERLVVDIGGGSTEFIRGRDEPMAARSVNIGCVRMTERHLTADPPTDDQIAAATADITEAVDTALAEVDPNRRAVELVGLAGSVTTVAALALGLTSYRPELIHHSRVSRAEVTAISARLLGETREQRLTYPVMHPGRADVIGGGALVLRIIMERTGIDTVLAGEHDILDGIAASLRG